MTRHLASARRRQRRRGTALLVFCLMVLPAMWAAGAMSVDAVRVVEAQRKVDQIAEAAALAGASQFCRHTDPCFAAVSGTGLDGSRAHQAAWDTLAKSWNTMFGANSSVELIGWSPDIKTAPNGWTDGTGAQSSFERDGWNAFRDPARVTVRIEFRVKNLSFMSIAGALESGRRHMDGSTSATANVCIDGTNPYTSNASCRRVR